VRWLIVALTVATVGCGARLVDPCAGVAGTCLAVQVAPSATVTRVDQLALSVTGDGVTGNKVVSKGKSLTLPVGIGIELGSLPRSPVSLTVTVDAIRDLQVDSFGGAGVTLSSGQHQTVTVYLDGTAPSSASVDMAAEGVDDLAGDFDLAPTGPAASDLASTDLAPADLGATDLESAIGCVQTRYVETNQCDWAHWSELYEVCHTYEYPALDDGYLLDEVKAGRCSNQTWPAMLAHIRQTAGLPPPSIQSAWRGTYITSTEYWGDTFSPLVIGDDGEVSVAETVVVPTYDAATSTLSFDWTAIKSTKAKATIHFTKDSAGKVTFSGSINPRPQDGPVGFTGYQVLGRLFQPGDRSLR
jgi:hypothetical protein